MQQEEGVIKRDGVETRVRGYYTHSRARTPRAASSQSFFAQGTRSTSTSTTVTSIGGKAESDGLGLSLRLGHDHVLSYDSHDGQRPRLL